MILATCILTCGDRCVDKNTISGIAYLVLIRHSLYSRATTMLSLLRTFDEYHIASDMHENRCEVIYLEIEFVSNSLGMIGDKEIKTYVKKGKQL